MQLSSRHWGTDTRSFLRGYLDSCPKDHLRIATGYFTVRGQDMLRQGFDTTAWILVGFEEDAPETEAENIVRLIQRELETTPQLTYEIIQRLADDLDERVSVVQTRYRRGDHAKVLIFGDSAAFLGSANLTVGGMRRNAESVQHVSDANEISGWIQDFDERWHDPDRTRDVTEELRKLLLEWLQFAIPFDAYLAACRALLDDVMTFDVRDDYLEPLPFQRVVARRAAASIASDDERGHWIIASTGLGKTIMATHVALMLATQGLIREAIVIAPARTLDEWDRRLRSASLSASQFSIAVLRRNPRGEAQIQSKKLQKELELADHRTLVIIDESHEFRNRFQANGSDVIERTFAKRLKPVVERQKSRVLLLTATPYAKNIHGINNQLQLLPGTADGRGTLGLFAANPHRIETLDEIYRLPVATVLSYATVRSQFADEDEHGAFVTHADGTKDYFAEPVVEEVPFEPLGAEAVLPHLPVFEHQVQMRTDPDTGDTNLDGRMVIRQMLEYLTSSPAALRSKLKKELENASNFQFFTSREARDALLRQMLASLPADVAEHDQKLARLRDLLGPISDRGDKALVFVNRLETGPYLKRELMRSGLRVEFLSGEKQDGEKIIAGFAPRANAASPRAQDLYDVLIATDTVAAGVNMQDATVVVHYDLPWTADVFHQRNGRITRFRREPRQTQVYLFSAEANLAKLSTLAERLQDAEIFQEISRMDFRHRELEDAGVVTERMSDARSSDVLTDFHVLEDHRARAAKLRYGLITAKYGGVEHKTVVVVVRLHGAGKTIAFRKAFPSPRGKRVVKSAGAEISDSEALDAFRCNPDEPIAVVPFPMIHAFVNEAIIELEEQLGLDFDEVRFVAAVCRVPEDEPRHLFART